jgi:hypothetical protein
MFFACHDGVLTLQTFFQEVSLVFSLKSLLWLVMSFLGHLDFFVRCGVAEVQQKSSKDPSWLEK